MSIIRQRSRNLLMSGVIGFMLALTAILLVYLLMVRGNEKVIQLLLRDSQLQVTEISETDEEEPLETTEVLAVTFKVEKGQLLTEEMIGSMQVEVSILPQNAIMNPEDVIGKKATSDIEKNTILTESMVRNKDVHEVANEIVEIKGIPVPEILQLGDRVNLRIHFPTGQDYTVVEDKAVIHMNMEAQTVFVELDEEEILAFSSAREDANIHSGTQIYLTKENQGLVESDSDPNAVIYENYPLNPNAMALSRVYAFDGVLLEDRVKLDESLAEFFDMDEERYAYVLKEADENTEQAGQGAGGVQVANVSEESDDNSSRHDSGSRYDSNNRKNEEEGNPSDRDGYDF